ncbi:Bgt-60039 [Blumeria graminis f. sp. tritici]|uniref:Bgt-60039 n=2 Tax=Blumeria graminis f. sp. tritici TaxID=62690 RepID=A0A9X9L7H1_BLUGR|nr:Bgt-60039 [Blumeria graminis f. sp. tritici]
MFLRNPSNCSISWVLMELDMIICVSRALDNHFCSCTRNSLSSASILLCAAPEEADCGLGREACV